MKKTLTSFLLIVVVCCSGFCQSADQYSPNVQARIKQVEQGLSGRFLVAGQPKHSIQERMAFYHINGLSIAVIHDYHLEWAKGYGWADSAEQRPVSIQTLFQAASISKSQIGRAHV